MGLSASQVRLLSLTARQHSIEGEAQRVMANKLHLSNESDMVYQKYLNALDGTTLKTMQTSDETGANSWIDASLNNLMRYNTEEGTYGKVFYVQDTSTGKLYVPDAIASRYEEVTDAIEFAKRFGVNYEEVDHNADIITAYEAAIRKGWNTALGPTVVEAGKILDEYYEALRFDTNVQGYAQSIVSQIPNRNKDDLYLITNKTDVGAYALFNSTLYNMVNNYDFEAAYTTDEKTIIKTALSLLTNVRPTYRTKEDFEEEHYNSITGTNEKWIWVNNFTFDELKVTAPNGVEYANRSGEEFKENDFLEMMLNGGTRVINYNVEGICSFPYLKRTDKEREVINIYDELTAVTGETVSAMLARTGYSSMASALSHIFENVTNSNRSSDAYLSARNLKLADIEHYKSYLELKVEYDSYVPDIELVPDDNVKAKYYEEIFNAIQSAGGCLTLPEKKAKSASWITNMIKNTQISLASWDSENNMLTKTSAALNTNLREIADQNAIEKADSEYETELEAINKKDERYDKKLSQLETERSAVKTEIDSLKKIMNDNIEKTFKLYG